MRVETFITKALGLRAHRVVKIEEDEAARNLVVHLDRREHRRLQCGECGRGAGRIVPTRRPTRRWRDLALREHLVELVYAPCRVWCARCGLRVERVPWAEKWQRVTHALARAVASLTRELTWSAVAHHFRVNWKTIAAVVEGAVLWGLQHRRWDPLHAIGIDEVSRRKGQRHVTIVYDLGRGRVVWVGRDRDAATMERFFAWLGPRRARAIHTFKHTRFLWLKNPENLAQAEHTRLSALLRLNSPIVRAHLLKEELSEHSVGGRPPVAVALARQSQSPRTVQEARPDAARSSRRRVGLDETPAEQRRCAGATGPSRLSVTARQGCRAS